MKLFKFNILFTKLKNMQINSSQEIFVVATNMENAMSMVTTEYKEDETRINNSQEVQGTVLIDKQIKGKK